MVVGGASIMGAALTQIGVPTGQILKFETDLKADRYVLLIHGTADEVKTARRILVQPKALQVA